MSDRLIRRLLWACDPSRVNPLTVRYVQQLAHWTEAEVWLVFVSTVPEETLAEFRQQLLPPEQLQQTVTARRDEAVAPLAEVARQLVETGLAVRTRVVSGESVGDGVVEAAIQCDADLIIMGARQKSLLRRLFSQDDTEATLRQSPVPLLIIPDVAAIDPGATGPGPTNQG